MTEFVINNELVQQIVDSVQEVVGRDINFIDKRGIIIASTDAARIGDFHEAAYEVIKKANSKIVENEEQYVGAKKGINYPVWVNDKVIAVIGITGEPQDVGKYGFIIKKITEVLITEEQIKKNSKNQELLVRNMITSFLYSDMEEAEYLIEHLHVDVKNKYAVMIIKMNSSCAFHNLDRIEITVKDFYEQIGNLIHTYIYPNEFLAFIDEKQYLYIKNNFTSLKKRFEGNLTIGIGIKENIYNIRKSYHYAKIANRTSIAGKKTITFADDLNLELIIDSLDTNVVKNYTGKVLNGLSDSEQKLLSLYFENDFSLKKTSEILFLHKNTVQCRLNKIMHETGLNPRKFQDAVVLYLALCMS